MCAFDQVHGLLGFLCEVVELGVRLRQRGVQPSAYDACVPAGRKLNKSPIPPSHGAKRVLVRLQQGMQELHPHTNIGTILYKPARL